MLGQDHVDDVCQLHSPLDRGFGHAEIGQAKAADKDLELAWERIETFLWRHVCPDPSGQDSRQGTSISQNHGIVNGNHKACGEESNRLKAMHCPD